MKNYDMQPKINKKNVYNAGKNTTNQELVFQHMSNHYRRILNAKKTVDTSPPYCYKPRRPASHQAKPTTCGRNTVGTPLLRNRNVSPALTERSHVSTNSYKGSWWGTESYAGSSRYHAACVQEHTTAPVKYKCVDMDLINRITYDTKNGPAAYCDEDWLKVKVQQNVMKYKKSPYEPQQSKTSLKAASNPKRRLQFKNSNEFQQKRKISRQRKQIEDVTSNKQFFTSYDSKFYPRILKTEAVSKLRTMRVYYPPRRRERIKSETETEPKTPSASNCKCSNICVCNPSETELVYKKSEEIPKESKISSRDSAYNGGVSSLPESRSPTPDQRRKKGCTCIGSDDSVAREVKLESKEENKLLKYTESYRMETPQRRVSRVVTPQRREPRGDICTKSEESLRKMKEDAMYIKFIQDITVEVLEKNLYTNKALKKVMKRHVMDNLQNLDKNRMLKEIDYLRIQLGIPEDKNFLDLDVDEVESVTDFQKLYPVISDSDFVLPKNFGEKSKSTSKKEEKTNGTLKKSVSEIIEKGSDIFQSGTEDDIDEDEISVIQVAKAIREKRKGKLFEKPQGTLGSSRGNSADESDQSSDTKPRSKTLSLKIDQRRNFDSPNPSSSETDSYLETNEKSQQLEDSLESSNLSISAKKSRSVSFWNKDLELRDYNKESVGREG